MLNVWQKDGWRIEFYRFSNAYYHEKCGIFSISNFTKAHIVARHINSNRGCLNWQSCTFIFCYGPRWECEILRTASSMVDTCTNHSQNTIISAKTQKTTSPSPWYSLLYLYLPNQPHHDNNTRGDTGDCKGPHGCQGRYEESKVSKVCSAFCLHASCGCHRLEQNCPSSTQKRSSKAPSLVPSLGEGIPNKGSRWNGLQV